MKYTLIIDPQREEEVLVYAHAHSHLTESIEALVRVGVQELIGYDDRDAVKLALSDVLCITIEDGKTFAVTRNKKYRLSQRLYVLEKQLDGRFVKINQSCLANVSGIRQFRASIGGALLVVFENGYTDYISRRQLRTVKERMGLK